MPTLAREIGRGTASAFLAESLALPAGLVLAAILSRSLGPEAYGRYGLAVTIVLALEWLLIAAGARASTQLLSDPQHRSALQPLAIRHHFLSGIAVMLLLMVTADLIGSALHREQLGNDLRWLALDIPFFSLAQVQRVVLTARAEYKLRSVAIATRWVSRVAATGALLSLGVHGAILAWPISSLAELLVVRRLPLAGVFSGWGGPPDIWRRSWPQMLFSASQRALEKMDLFVLQSSQASASAVGVYVAAQNLSILPGLLGSALTPILMATMTRERALGREAESRHAAVLSFKVILYLLPLAAIFAACGEDLARFAFGRSYTAAAAITGFLVAGYIGIGLLAAAASVLTSQGEERLSVLASLPLAILATIAQALVTPRFGSTGAAVVTATAGLATGAVATALVYRQWAERFPILLFVRATLAAGATVGVAQWHLVSSLVWPLRGAMLAVTAALTLVALGEWRMFTGLLRILRPADAPGAERPTP